MSHMDCDSDGRNNVPNFQLTKFDNLKLKFNFKKF